MSKYRPLSEYLRKNELSEIVLSFAEIERLVGLLPESKERPQFWANSKDSTPKPQRDAVRDAGYQSFLLRGMDKVRFVKVGPGINVARTVTPSPKPTVVKEGKPPLTVEILLAGGFSRVSEWAVDTEGRLVLGTPAERVSGVYAFVKGGRAVYVGIAATNFHSRWGFYMKPGPKQTTSIRLNGLLKDEFNNGTKIDIYTVSPPLLSWNGFAIDTAAGLEVALIKKFDLAWNKRGA